MKVRIIELEGTPEELESSPYLRRLATNGAVLVDQATTAEGGDEGPALPGISAELQARGIEGRVRELLESFIGEVMLWDDVEPPEWGTPGPTSKADYIRLRRTPPEARRPGRPPGAFVYVFPSRAAVRLRLRSEEIANSTYAKARGVKETDPYQVQVALHHDGMVEEALSLAKRAYERAAEEVVQKTTA